MSSTNQSEEAVEDGVVLDENPACVALVPVASAAQWSPHHGQRSLPSSIFVTHLIATAEQMPQTRTLRRATPADAQTAYGASRHQAQGAGFLTQQII